MSTTAGRSIGSGLRSVEGWLEPLAAHLIRIVSEVQRENGLSGAVGEIGVHHGKLFILLNLLAGKGERRCGWDLFERQLDNVDQSGCGDREILLRNLERHVGDLEETEVFQANSLDLGAEDLVQALRGPARLFSIDGGHTAQITRHDLEIVAPALGEGGVILLDDYFNPAWPGVSEGVLRFFFDHPGELVPVAVGGNKLLLTNHREWARRYREALTTRAAGSKKLSEFCDEPVLIVEHDPGIVAWLRRRAGWKLLRTTRAGLFLKRTYKRWTGR